MSNDSESSNERHSERATTPEIADSETTSVASWKLELKKTGVEMVEQQRDLGNGHIYSSPVKKTTTVAPWSTCKLKKTGVELS